MPRYNVKPRRCIVLGDNRADNTKSVSSLPAALSKMLPAWQQVSRC